MPDSSACVDPTDPSPAHPTIVVGIDGSKAALTATRWAAGEAARSGSQLKLWHALRWPQGHTPLADLPLPDPRSGRMRDLVYGWLDEATQLARSVAGDLGVDVDVEAEVRPQGPIEMLTEASKDVSIVALGCQKLAGIGGLLLGSTVIGVSAGASSPVVVVRGHRALATDGPVVVGLDPRSSTDPALEFAFRRAASLRTGLVVVHARPGHGPGPVDITDRVAHVANRYPAVAVIPTAVGGQPTRYLLEASRSAAMLVVGGRGRGAAAGALLGSTSQALIRGSECPVAVVRDQVVLDQLASRRHSLCS